MAWTRKVGAVEELIFASDSRLREGDAWDACPKILALPRSDCLISFAGRTETAYPLILQMIKAVEFYPASLNRQQDIDVVRGHTIRVFNQMWRVVHDLPRGQTKPDIPLVDFIFGGFSWRQGRFRIWKLHYDDHLDAFTFRPVRPWAGQTTGSKTLAIASDVNDEAKGRVVELLRSRGKLGHGSFDMEPFEVLRDMIRGNQFPTIGGAPQVAKVYRYLRTQFFGVRWPDASGRPHALGRPALDYESFDAPTIDPDDPAAHSFQPLRRESGMLGAADPNLPVDLGGLDDSELS